MSEQNPGNPRSPRGLNAYLRDVVRLGQLQRGEELGRDERTIRRWDRDDRKSTQHIPVTPLQQEAFERCQVGNHGWMVRGELFADCYTPVCLSGGEYPTGELIEETYGKRTTTRTCWFCGFTTEPRDEWGQVWVLAADVGSDLSQIP